ncbi:MAG TPA: hypothetical protein VF184_04445 [Phycisphaeraceae bacterium]
MIVYSCPDLIFATKIRATAEALGVLTRPARDAQALRHRLEQVDDGRPNEPVTALMVDLDLGPLALELLEQAKRHNPDIPVIAYGSHVAKEVLGEARRRGADLVLPRSAFVARLPQLLQQYADKA